MVWCRDIVEIVRRITRELFHHELLIGNFSGKYLVTTRKTRVFAGKCGQGAAKDDGREPLPRP
jgi:hypothetical protein